MSVSKMKLFHITGNMDSLDATLFACGKTGVSQPDDTLTFFTSGLKPINESNPYTEPLNRLESAVSRIGDKLKTPDTEIKADTDKQALLDYVEYFSNQVEKMKHMHGQLAVRLEQLNKDCEQFENFIGLGIDLDAILACKTIKVRFGRLPLDSYEKLEMYDANPYVLFFPGVANKDYYWGVYFAPLNHADEVDRVFSGLYFERLRIPAAIGKPEEVVQQLKEQKQEVVREYEQIDRQVNDFWESEKQKCMQVYSKLLQLNYYFSARRFAARYNNKFALAGWIPACDEKQFCLTLDTADDIEYSL